MDTTQLLLSVVLVVTTVLLVAVGIQLVFILRHVRRILGRIDRVVEVFEKMGVEVRGSLAEVKGFVLGMKSLVKLMSLLKIGEEKNVEKRGK